MNMNLKELEKQCLGKYMQLERGYTVCNFMTTTHHHLPRYVIVVHHQDDHYPYTTHVGGYYIRIEKGYRHYVQTPL